MKKTLILFMVVASTMVTGCGSTQFVGSVLETLGENILQQDAVYKKIKMIACGVAKPIYESANLVGFSMDSVRAGSICGEDVSTELRAKAGSNEAMKMQACQPGDDIEVTGEPFSGYVEVRKLKTRASRKSPESWSESSDLRTSEQDNRK